MYIDMDMNNDLYIYSDQINMYSNVMLSNEKDTASEVN